MSPSSHGRQHRFKHGFDVSAASVSKRARAALVSAMVSAFGRPLPRVRNRDVGLGRFRVSHVRADLDTRIKYDLATTASPSWSFLSAISRVVRGLVRGFSAWSGARSGVIVE